MNKVCFKKPGWFFLTVYPLGFLTSALAILFLIPVFMVIIRNGHSVSDDLYHIFVYTTCTAFWWKWVAEKASRQKSVIK